jgi:hypothetical protein
VDHREYDHASISATLRELFGLGAAPPRTRRAASFLDNVSSEAARRGDELPDLSRFLAAGAASFDGAGAAEDVPLAALDEFQQSLVELAAQVDVRLEMEDATGGAGPAAAGMPPISLEWMPLPGGPTGAMVPAAVAPAGAAAAYSEAVAERLLASTPQTIRLRTPRGESIDEPSRAQIERALDEALAGGADVSTWAADQEDRSVTVRGDNVVQLRLPDAGVRAERSLRSAADALQLIDLLRAGDIATLRAQF